MVGTTRSSTRLSDTILDLDYGDEQERFRYYEAYAVMIHLQLIALPLAGAAALFALGSSATVSVLVMLAAWYVSAFVGLAYLRRHGVRFELIASSARNRWFRVASVVAYAAMMVALVTTAFERWPAFTVGAQVGVGLGVVMLGFGILQQRNVDTVDTDGEQ